MPNAGVGNPARTTPSLRPANTPATPNRTISDPPRLPPVTLLREAIRGVNFARRLSGRGASARRTFLSAPLFQSPRRMRSTSERRIRTMP
jgi:hypothetical protein